MKKFIITAMVFVLVFCGAVSAKPFVISAAQKLAAYAKAQGYTQQQIENAPKEVVFKKIDIDPNSPQAKKYTFFEPIIKAHVIQMLYPPVLSDSDKLLSAVRSVHPEATITPTADPNEFSIRIKP